MPAPMRPAAHFPRTGRARQRWRGGGAVLVLHDISDLRRADRVRRDFVANVSHELRTPLTAVRGYVEALMDEPTTPEQRTKFLEVIDRHTGRMERLVRDLLRLARLDAQQEIAELACRSTSRRCSRRSPPISPSRIERQHMQVDVDGRSRCRRDRGRSRRSCTTRCEISSRTR